MTVVSWFRQPAGGRDGPGGTGVGGAPAPWRRRKENVPFGPEEAWEGGPGEGEAHVGEARVAAKAREVLRAGLCAGHDLPGRTRAGSGSDCLWFFLPITFSSDYFSLLMILAFLF